MRETPKTAEKKIKIQKKSWKKKGLQEIRKHFIQLGKVSSLKGQTDWKVSEYRNQLEIFSKQMLNSVNITWSIHSYSSLTEK